ncbi:MAG: quinone-dependent dihydroorotate dehydrogenase [Deltaproteobacteria bacterium]|nr:quinone-dependent dihydroorotate dehydrogenase [Deltaproteobacteria bacterium]
MWRSLVRPALFTLDAAEAHELATAAMGPLEHVPPLRALVRAMCAARDPRVAVQTMGLSFPSPLGLAGGFDKNAHRPHALAAIGFGFLELGTVTARAQEQNPTPNLFRLPADRALINRLGFPNEGAAQVALRFVEGGGAASCGVPVGFSIGKSRVVDVDPIEGAIEDYLASFRAVHPVSDFVVVNVSSPNTKNLRALQGADVARALLSALVRENQGRKPLLLKIAPDLGDADLEALLAVVDEVGLDGVVATNTTIGRADLRTPREVVDAIGAGGLSGPPLRLRAREIVRRVRARLGKKITVVGVGGVENAGDVLALVRAGADLVQMYTGFIYGGPFTPRRIARELGELVTRAGATSIRELVGTE